MVTEIRRIIRACGAVCYRLFGLKHVSGQVGCYRFAHGLHMAKRASLINHLITKLGYKTYLEIGVRDGNCIEQVIAAEKTGVDPAASVEVDYKMTSDEYFKQLPVDKKFDIIFIDGMHTEAQAKKDVLNALKHLSANGSIVMHDCNPPDEFSQREVYAYKGSYPVWNGTVWKAWLYFRCKDRELDMNVVDTDWGCGVIQRGKQRLYNVEGKTIDYSLLAKHRVELLNLISVRDFLEKY